MGTHGTISLQSNITELSHVSLAATEKPFNQQSCFLCSFKDLEPVQGHFFFFFFREGSFVSLKQLQKEFDILQSNFV